MKRYKDALILTLGENHCSGYTQQNYLGNVS